MPRYTVTKTFGAEMGLSACFRQHRATHSHCRHLHGYALSFEFVIGSNILDVRGWVFDFGAFGRVKDYLRNMFDHTLCIAKDDPQLTGPGLKDLEGRDLCTIRVFEKGVGCERFAEHLFDQFLELVDTESGGRARLMSVTCREHGANAATYHNTL